MHFKKQSNAFTFVELLVIIAIIAILFAIAVPLYQNHVRRAYFVDIVKMVEPYKSAVTKCVHDLGNPLGCDAGKHGIPKAIVNPHGNVNSITVKNGIITATPILAHGVNETDLYILAPTNKAGAITWVSSGAAVSAGYVNN
jgi:Tfp pilus assembly major pilin PilA